MADDKKDPWLNYMAFTTVFFALFATLSTFKGGGFSTKAVISQALASDQWAYYQAKGVKQNLYEVQVQNLKLASGILPPGTPDAVRAQYAVALEKAEGNVAKYEKDKDEISDKAKAYETARDAATEHGKPMGYAVILLQVAIVLSSVAGLMKRKLLWQLALPFGLLGMVLFADGFLLFYPL